MAGQAKKEGIGERFDAAMNPEDETDEFLITAVDYCTNKLGLDKDVLLKELADAVIGCYYPMPRRSSRPICRFQTSMITILSR